MKKFVHNICSQLKSGNDLILASIIESSGSTPRSSGSKMAILRSGEIDGTIGGGLVEALIQRAAAKILESQKHNLIFKEFDLSNELAANADMICGGQVTVMMEYVPADKKNIDFYTTFAESLKHGHKATVITITDNDKTASAPEKILITQNQELPKIQGITDTDFSELIAASIKTDKPIIKENFNQRLIIESFSPEPTVFIFGAGHVSRPTALLATTVNFRTVILDDRKDFANAERFPQADEIIVLPDFEDAFDNLEVTDNSYVIIVTRGHLHDKTVLAQALKTPARYVGMIGSFKKRNAIYEALLNEGIKQNDIDRCQCPIGLAIEAQTPEEIAVSIIAELIQTRARD